MQKTLGDFYDFDASISKSEIIMPKGTNLIYRRATLEMKLRSNCLGSNLMATLVNICKGSL